MKDLILRIVSANPGITREDLQVRLAAGGSFLTLRQMYILLSELVNSAILFCEPRSNGCGPVSNTYRVMRSAP